MAQATEHLPSKYEVLNSNTSTTKRKRGGNEEEVRCNRMSFGQLGLSFAKGLWDQSSHPHPHFPVGDVTLPAHVYCIYHL
jgi:hypothetical protein